MRSTMSTDVPSISFRNLQRVVKINLVDLEQFAQRALELCLQTKKSGPTELTNAREISVLLVSDRRMTGLHRKFLHKTGPTDVLTFQHGEIVINIEMAVRNARRFESSLEQELRLYLVHGLLHLHGFDDQSKAGARKMEVAQKQILRRATR
ncbi:MAG TPA: rRNA maturation RNase YbeY [Chthoniobacterales bacterium]|nr:rRNA maturation RNase YbeY [Chthoniobacterales bacterium]